MARSGFDKRFPQRDEAAATLLAMNVRRLREAKGLSQGELATAAGIPQQSISLIENARANPALLMLDTIAGALGVQMVELFDAKTPAGKAFKSKAKKPA